MEIFEQFLLFEQNNKLFEKEVKGFQYWIYIRQEIFAELSEIELENKKIKKDSRKNRVNWENILVSLLFHNPFLKKGNSTFLFFRILRYIIQKRNIMNVILHQLLWNIFEKKLF